MLLQSDRERKTFIGLGNPGKKYAMTRHNMGHLVIHAFASRHGILLKEEKKFCAKFGQGVVQNVSVHLLLPTTYMNESGLAVRHYVDYFQLLPEEIVVVSDDIALPFGMLRLRSQGTAGGHKGLKSVETHLGTTDYPRLRMGIGRGRREEEILSAYVLDRFTKEESNELTAFIEKGLHTLEQLLVKTVVNVMNVVNEKNQKERKDGKAKPL